MGVFLYSVALEAPQRMEKGLSFCIFVQALAEEMGVFLYRHSFGHLSGQDVGTSRFVGLRCKIWESMSREHEQKSGHRYPEGEILWFCTGTGMATCEVLRGWTGAVDIWETYGEISYFGTGIDMELRGWMGWASVIVAVGMGSRRGMSPGTAAASYQPSRLCCLNSETSHSLQNVRNNAN